MWFGEAPTGSGVAEGGAAPFTYIAPEVDGDGNFEPVLRGRYPGRPGVRPPNMVVKAVCAKCNGGWMSNLESSVIPLIRKFFEQRKVQFKRTEVSLLVRWCQKTMAVLDVWNPDSKCVTPEVYSALLNNEPPPGTWDVRIARVVDEMEFAFALTPLTASFVLMGEPNNDSTGDSALESMFEIPSPSAIGVQAMFCIGTLLFMVRYSPHSFRGPTSIDADYYQVLHPPQTLLGREARRIFKPGSMPVYNYEDWNIWVLWSVAKEPGVAPCVGADNEGNTFVDSMLGEALHPDFEVIGEPEFREIDVGELMSRPVRWDDQ
jgi:hypothetical protein